ncbi:MAG TPA: DUF1080 domain-containing protein [Flavobacteriaceae bacterium]|nr:DUF1080 domain-containing protein [Flavobacteriaceae bacterium]
MKKTIILLILFLAFVACKDQPKKETETISEEVVTTEVATEQEKEWVSLFDGKTLNGWHVYNGGDINSHWKVEDGVLAFVGRKGSPEYNIVTDKEYTNFKLSLEWKISEGGNSGIILGVVEDERFPSPYTTGIEIQVLDNEKHPDGKFPNHNAGALYDLIVPPSNIAKPVGEWNTCEIYINHNTNEGKAWLNGTLTAEFPLSGKKWEEMIANSKFKDWEYFAKSKTGRICLQDHEDKVWYRNIKIQEL